MINSIYKSQLWSIYNGGGLPLKNHLVSKLWKLYPNYLSLAHISIRSKSRKSRSIKISAQYHSHRRFSFNFSARSPCYFSRESFFLSSQSLGTEMCQTLDILHLIDMLALFHKMLKNATSWSDEWEKGKIENGKECCCQQKNILPWLVREKLRNFELFIMWSKNKL